MSTGKQPEVTAPAPASAPAPVPAADKYAVEDLIARASDFLGYQSFVVAGALHGKSGDLTLDAARELVKSWLDTPLTKEA